MKRNSAFTALRYWWNMFLSHFPPFFKFSWQLVSHTQTPTAHHITPTPRFILCCKIHPINIAIWFFKFPFINHFLTIISKTTQNITLIRVECPSACDQNTGDARPAPPTCKVQECTSICASLSGFCSSTFQARYKSIPP